MIELDYTGIVDFVAMLLVAFSVLIAWIRGALKEVVSLCGWLATGFCAMLCMPYVKRWVKGSIPNDMLADAIAVGTTFVAFALIFTIISRTIMKRMKENESMGLMDKALGLGFGAMRGAVIVLMLSAGVTKIYSARKMPTWMSDSKTVVIANEGITFVTTQFPGIMNKLKAIERI